LTYPLPTKAFFAKEGIALLDVVDHVAKPTSIGLYRLDSKQIDDRTAHLLDAIKRRFSQGHQPFK